MQPIPASRLVSVVLRTSVGTGTEVYIPFQKELDGRRVHSVIAIDANVLTADVNGVAIVSSYDSWTLTMKEDSIERHYLVPLNSLVTESNGGIWKPLVPFIWNTANSYFQPVAPITVTTPIALALLVLYELDPAR